MRTPVLKVVFSASGHGYDGNSRYYHIYVDVEVHDSDNDETPDDFGTKYSQSPPTSSYRSDTDFHRVHLTSQTHGEHLGDPSRLNTLDPFYGVHIQWSGSNNDLRDFEEGVKALRKIDRHLTRLDKVAGSPKSFGEYVLRLGKAMGIRRAYVPVPGSSAFNSYCDLDHASTLIDRQIGEWMARFRENYAKAAECGVA